MNSSKGSEDENAEQDVAARLLHLKRLSLRQSVAALERSAKELCMLAGSLAARCAAQRAALEAERAKAAVLESRIRRYDAPLAGLVGEPEGRPASMRTSMVDAWTQTEDDEEALREELQRLHQARDELQAATRNAPMNLQNRVDLLKKRNAVLLAREERAFQRARAERLEKEKRVSELQERLARLKAQAATRTPRPAHS